MNIFLKHFLIDFEVAINFANIFTSFIFLAFIHGIGGLPIALFSDGEGLSGSGSGTPSDDDLEEEADEQLDNDDVVEAGDDDTVGSSEDLEEEIDEDNS